MQQTQRVPTGFGWTQELPRHPVAFACLIFCISFTFVGLWQIMYELVLEHRGIWETDIGMVLGAGSGAVVAALLRRRQNRR